MQHHPRLPTAVAAASLVFLAALQQAVPAGAVPADRGPDAAVARSDDRVAVTAWLRPEAARQLRSLAQREGASPEAMAALLLEEHLAEVEWEPAAGAGSPWVDEPVERHDEPADGDQDWPDDWLDDWLDD